jgi:DNA-binding cell septation regulator SpoVG
MALIANSNERLKAFTAVAFDLEWVITEVWNVRAATISG